MNELAQPILSMPMFIILGFISLMLIGLLAEQIERIQDKKTHQYCANNTNEHSKNTHIYYNQKIG